VVVGGLMVDGPASATFACGCTGASSSSSSSSSSGTMVGPPPEKNPAGRIELLTTSSVLGLFELLPVSSAGLFDFVELCDCFSLVTDARCCFVRRWASHCFTTSSACIEFG
jgi:hypothetical protein